jgi:O-antigen ligase
MKNSIVQLNNKYNMDMIFLVILLFSLPVAHVTAVQNISLLFFVSLVFITGDNFLYKKLKNISAFFVPLIGLLILSIISIYYSVDYKETISEIKSEFIKPILITIFFFIFTYKLNDKRLRYLFIILLGSLLFHTIYNLYTWQIHGYWPYRAGGLLDDGGGERFGIWATYAFAIAIAIQVNTKYCKISVLFILLTLISILANNTRATYVALIFIVLMYLLFLYKNLVMKKIIIFLLLVGIVIGINYSGKLSSRYNVLNVISNINNVLIYNPSDFNNFSKTTGIGHSISARLAMWKSVLSYRIDNPIILNGYGRFLYGKSIVQECKNDKSNIPYQIFSQCHNDYMSILYSLGVFGLMLFIYLFIYLLKIAYVVSQNKQYKSFGVFVFLGTIGYMVSMMFGSFFGDSEQEFFYILTGIILALYIRINEDNNEKHKLHTS